MPPAAAAVVLASHACSCVLAGSGDGGEDSDALVGGGAAELAGLGGSGCDGGSVLVIFEELRRCCLGRAADAAGFDGKATDASGAIHGLRTEPPRNRFAVRLEFSTSRTAVGGGRAGGCDVMMQAGHGQRARAEEFYDELWIVEEGYFGDVRALARRGGAPSEGNAADCRE